MKLADTTISLEVRWIAFKSHWNHLEEERAELKDCSEKLYTPYGRRLVAARRRSMAVRDRAIDAVADILEAEKREEARRRKTQGDSELTGGRTEGRDHADTRRRNIPHVRSY